MSRLKLLVTLLVIGAMVAVVSFLKWDVLFSRRIQSPVASRRVVGNPKARVKIVEFTDFQCPACAKGAETVHALIDKPDPGIFLELKYFPLKMHHNAYRAAVAAQCALEQGKFWPMHHVLFRSQSSWAGMENPDDYFLGLVRGLGMDDAGLMKCMAEPLSKAVVDQDVAQGEGMGVKATPTFFINGKMVVGVPAFEKALKEALL